MKNKNNIEDIFKNAFQDAEETPSQKVWNNLNKKLFVKNFAQKFVNFSVKPSEKVWIAINRQLLWKQFLHFSFTKFNVYYASIIGIITIFGIFYLNNNTSNNNSEIKYLNSKNIINNVINKPINYIAYTNNKNIIDNTRIDNNRQNTTNNFTKNINRKKINKNYSNLENNATKLKTNKIIANKSIKNNSDIGNSATLHNNKSVDNINKITDNRQNIFENKNLSNTNKITALNLDDTKNNTNISSSETLKNNSNITNISQKVNNVSSSGFNVSVITKSETKQTEQNKLFLLNKLFISNLYNPVDSFYNIYNPDTVGIDAFGDVITIDKSQIFVDIFASAQLNKYNFASQSGDNTYSKLISDATTGKESYAFGARLTYFYKNYLFQSGVGITNFTEKINYDYNTQQITSTNFYTYFNTTQTVYDTIQIVNLDSLLANGDTVYSQYIKQNTITVLDSNLQTKIDTNTVKQNLNTRNVYTYIEVPAIIGYRFTQNKFSYNLSGGAIFGFFIKDKGSIISQNNVNEIQQLNKSLPYIKPNISAVIKFGITYKLSDKISVLAEPFYRKNINSWFDKSNIYSKRNSAYGITLGTRIFIK